MLLTRSPLYSSPCGDFLARLACVRHAASVRSEPGSNSPRLFSLSMNERSRTIPSWRTEMEMHMCPPHKLVAMIFDCQRTEMAGSRASRHLNSRTSRPEPRAPLFGRPPSHGTLCVPDFWKAVNYFYRIIFPENIDRRDTANRDLILRHSWLDFLLAVPTAEALL